MKISSAALGTAKWLDLHPKNEDDKTETVKETAQHLDAYLSDFLLSENLVLLCGAGTSLSVVNASGDSIAPSMSTLWEEIVKKTGKDFKKIVATVKYKKPGDEDNIELLLSCCQLSERFNPSKEIYDFINLAEREITSKCRFVSDDTDLRLHEIFLRKVARRPTRKPRLQLFTTNYDTCFEAAANRSRFITIDGFSHTLPQEFDGTYFEYDLVRRDPDRESPDFLPNVFLLHKVHGSVDWKRIDDRILKDDKADKPLLIYPRHSKYELSYEQPFIEMMARFQLALRQVNTSVLIIGFGFNDGHLCQPLMSAVRSNVGLKLLVVDKELQNASTKKEPLRQMRSLIDHNDRRISLLEGDFGEFAEILPDLGSSTEEEAHLKRFREARKK